MHPPERDWMIVAPWWKWSDPPPDGAVTPDPFDGRLSRPIFQKYDSPNAVNDFIKNPQRSLVFGEEDLVHALRAAPLPSVSLAGKLFRFSASRFPDNTVVDKLYRPDGTNTRKIFLNTHKRFYLVVCSIHCDGPGFPKAARRKVCKAGFVVRRRTLDPPSCAVKEVQPILRRLTDGRARLATVNQLAEIEHAALGEDVTSAKFESLLKTRASLQALVRDERSRFEEWVDRFGLVPELQGWFPSAEADKVGCWNKVAETPAELGDESSFPLYPLIPDGTDQDHDGHFGTIYFGVLPTSAHDCDPRGRARFDDRQTYEIRCWALRHFVPHDADVPCKCPDRLFWSRPTRPYKLASQFDLTGTSHQPVTIQLPDLNELAAQAKPTLGVGLAKPPGSLMISGNSDGEPTNPGRSTSFEICFFPIPLITIVATFVFQLFLPVIMLIFQLWWMLALKFCIPPEISVATGIDAEINIEGDLAVNAAVEVDIAASITTSINSQFTAPVANALLQTYSPIALANMQVAAASASRGTGAAAPSPAAGVEFEAEVTHT